MLVCSGEGNATDDTGLDCIPPAAFHQVHNSDCTVHIRYLGSTAGDRIQCGGLLVHNSDCNLALEQQASNTADIQPLYPWAYIQGQDLAPSPDSKAADMLPSKSADMPQECKLVGYS